MKPKEYVMEKIKHSKFKNTGIIFELLVRQVTADILNNKDSWANQIIKEHFNKKCLLGKELQLYRTLIEKKFNSESKAKELIDAVLKEKSKLNPSELKKEKYSLISKIKESYNIDEFFQTKISNYKILASIYKLFENVNNDVLSPSDKVQTKYTIIENILSSPISKNKVDEETENERNKILERYKKESKELRLLIYKTMLERFNKKYNVLDSSQKNLLKNYITNISNTNSFRELVNVEVDSVKEKLGKLNRYIKDSVTKIKLKEVVKQIDNLKRGQIVKEEQILSLMRYYELIKEIKRIILKEEILTQEQLDRI